MKSRRLLGQLVFAGAFAVIPPAIAASANMAMASDTAASENVQSRIVADEVIAENAGDNDNSRVATHAPTRLSPLAGTDSIARDSANSIHAWHRSPVK